MSRMQRSRVAAVFLSLALGLTFASAFARSADARRLGSVAPPRLGSCTSCSVLQLETAVGEPSYVVPPGNWKITSWAAQGGGTAAGQARLQVYRPTHRAGQFRLVKQSTVEPIPKNGHPFFTTNLNVVGGDLLGFRTETNLASGHATGVDGDNIATVSCEPLDIGHVVGVGTTCTLGQLPGELANILVTIVRR